MLLVINDLMFVSGLRAQAESAGWRVGSARDLSKLEELINSTWDLILFDLDARSRFALDQNPEFLEKLQSADTIAFYSHMDQEAYQAGKQLGFTQIVPRSKLSEKLKVLLDA